MTRFLTITLLGFFSAGCVANQSTENLLTYEQATAPVYAGSPYPPDQRIRPGHFEIDLDHDGVPELLVEQPLTRGNAGVYHSIYTQQNWQNYQFPGDYEAKIRVVPVQ